MDHMNTILRTLLLFFALVGLSLGTELVGTPTVEFKDGAASIRWKTSVESGTVVKFGTDAKNLLRKAEGELGDQHNVVLEKLQPGTTYHYQVGTSKKGLGMFSFKTPGTAPASTASPAAKAAPAPAAGAATAAAAAKPENKPLLKRLFGFLGNKEESAPAPAKPVAKVDPAKPKAQTQAQAQAKAPTPTPAQSTQEAPPTRETWANVDTLEDHYVRHGKDFKSKSADEYAAAAWLFLQRAIRDGLPIKQAGDGTLRVWDPKDRSFASFTKDLRTRTYFRPNSWDYFDRQEGKPVKLVRKGS